MKWSILVSLLLALLTFGCRYGETLLGEVERTVDPRRPFPDFVAEGQPWDFPLCDGWEGSGAIRVRLGDLFTAERPAGQGWATVETSVATLLVRYPPQGSTPTAFVYAERINPDVSGGLGVALRQFQGRLDRRFQRSAAVAEEAAKDEPPAESETADTPADVTSKNSTNPTAADPTSAATPPPAAAAPVPPPPTTLPAAGRTPLGSDDLSRVVQDLGEQVSETVENLASAGRNRGYSSEPGTFTGWRWIGQCGEPDSPAPTADAPPSASNPTPDTTIKPFLRLGRTEGSWSLQSGTEPLPAFMVLATVTLPDRLNYGIHLAIVCTEAPQCEAAPDLARLLGSLRLATGATATVPVSWGSEDLRDLAKDVGVRLPEAAAP